MWKTSVVIAPADAVNAPAPLKGDIADTIKNASEIGFDAVQITVNRPEEFDLANALKAMSAYRVKVSSIATGGAYAIDRISLGHKDEKKRLASVARMKAHIDLAENLGGADVVIGLIRGRFADCDTKQEYLKLYKESVWECVQYAERKSIRIMHEAIGRTDSDVLRTIRENVVFLHEFESPNLKLQIDTHHMGLEETDFYTAILQAKDLIGQVDISDVKRGIPNGKDFDFPRLIDALKQIDYQQYLVFEFDSAGNGVAEASAGFRYIRSLY